MQQRVDPVQTPQSETWLTRERVLVLVLALVSVLVAYLVWRLVQPFVAPITWAMVLAVLAHPLHERIKQHVRWPSVAAGVAVVVVTTVIALPATFVVRQAGNEAIESVTTLRKLITGERWKVLIDRFPRAAAVRRGSSARSTSTRPCRRRAPRWRRACAGRWSAW